MKNGGDYSQFIGTMRRLNEWVAFTRLMLFLAHTRHTASHSQSSENALVWKTDSTCLKIISGKRHKPQIVTNSNKIVFYPIKKMPRVFYVLSMQGCNDVPLPSQAHGWGWRGGLQKLPDATCIRWPWSQRRLPRWKDASWEEARGRGWKRIPGEGTYRTNPETKKGHWWVKGTSKDPRVAGMGWSKNPSDGLRLGACRVSYLLSLPPFLELSFPFSPQQSEIIKKYNLASVALFYGSLLPAGQCPSSFSYSENALLTPAYLSADFITDFISDLIADCMPSASAS